MNGSTRGKVYCKLTFEKDGSISSIDIVKSPHNCYSQEALRVIKLMQNWIPAKLNNQPVKFSLILPINFE